MSSHIGLGRHGEALAKKYLEENGFQVLNTNWKYSYYEIDIIASRNDVLHFVEVKTRRSQRYGLPEESVDRKKFSRLLLASEEYMFRYPGWKRVQYDVLSISIMNEEVAYFFIEDVYL